jgi:hypothetical protein
MGGLTYGAVWLLGADGTGPVVVALALVATIAFAGARRVVAGRTLTAEG